MGAVWLAGKEFVKGKVKVIGDEVRGVGDRKMNEEG